MVSGTRVGGNEMERCGQIGDVFGDSTDRASWWFRGKRVEVNKRTMMNKTHCFCFSNWWWIMVAFTEMRQAGKERV